MKSTLFTLVFCLNAAAALAQAGQASAGLRLGYPWSASVKYFIADDDALEAYVGWRPYSFSNAVSVAAAYQRHYSFDLDDEFEPLRWYWGAGATVAFNSYDFDPFFLDDDYARTQIGINGYLGVQYAFEDVPLEITFDWVPSVFPGRSYLQFLRFNRGGVAVRYILNQ